ncbi:unnamed protein product [Echinostoma caproni]|uniref:Lipocln_cytosolic_FA-bd_dom domain-containing protein n=1 Tax=Echinostoma caproni TaxID=27848 RepID=A0A183AUM1_9TREM|nr:unnamed protein product [Echinostoma caproni]
MAHFVGTWKLESSENLDAVLHKLGINMIKRKLITSTKPEITFTLDGNKMTMKTCSALKTTTISFTFGEEFKEETADGRSVMVSYFPSPPTHIETRSAHPIDAFRWALLIMILSTFTKESDDKICQVQKHPDNTTHVVREVHGNQMTAVSKHTGLVNPMLPYYCPPPPFRCFDDLYAAIELG